METVMCSTNLKNESGQLFANVLCISFLPSQVRPDRASSQVCLQGHGSVIDTRPSGNERPALQW